MLASMSSQSIGLVSLLVHQLMPVLFGHRKGPGFGGRERQQPVFAAVVGITAFGLM